MKTSSTAAVTPMTKTLRARTPASTRATPAVSGATFSTPTSRSRTRASSSVSLRMVVTSGPMAAVVALPGCTPRMRVPNWVNSARMSARAPSPIDVRRMTDAIPIRIPTMVRAERSRPGAVRRWGSCPR